MSPAASLAARVAGAVTALGYLVGIVDGPVVGVVGGLGLVSLGRALVAEPGGELIGPSAFALIAGSSGVVALRWGTLNLADIRGVQGVLGPTVVVTPEAAAIACGAALVGGVAALGLWLGRPGAGPAGGHWWWVELLTGALLLTALYAGPSPAGLDAIATWVIATGLIAGTAVLGGRITAGLALRWRIAILIGAGAAIAGAAATVGAAV